MAGAVGDITLALRTAQSGLLANQGALNTVANNIANVNSAGYSRKVVNLEQRVLAGTGAGVQISEITRKVDEGLLRSLRLELVELRALTVQTSFFGRTQDLFGSPEANTSFSHTIEQFTDALETLAVSPEKALEQSNVVRWGQNVVLQLQDMSRAVQELRLQADKAIAERVTEINALTKRIGELNDDIISNGTIGRDVSDLRDQRDQKLDRLHELIDVRYFFRADGDVVAFTSSGDALVDIVPETLSHNAASSVTTTITQAEGDFDGIFAGARVAGNDITNLIRGGELKGLIELRDSILPNLQSQIDELAARMRDSFNQIHNRGTPFPGRQSLTGTRRFIAPTTQTISLDPTGSVDDVTLALFDASGDQKEVTTLNTIMTSASFGTGAQASRGPWTITEVAATIEDWLQDRGLTTATASIVTTGQLAINLNSTTTSLAFRDETATANGSTLADAEIAFDANGDGVTDETVNGFSSFFGLNDFFVDGLGDNVWESDVLASSFTAKAATLTFRDSTGTLTGSPFTVSAGDSITTIASNITSKVTNITATLVPDGSGLRLRISHDQGKDITVTQAAANTFLTDIGLDVADVRVSANLAVRTDIVATSAGISRGSVQWNANLGVSGEYFMSAGDNDIAEALARDFTSTNTFKAAGGIGAITNTFSEYAAGILATNATLADNNEQDVDFQKALTDSLQLKSDSLRGVNLDEELANLILFEQAFIAAARVIAVIQRMFDALDRAI